MEDDAPYAISNKQIVEPIKPAPTTVTGENLSPSCPVMNEPPILWR